MRRLPPAARVAVASATLSLGAIALIGHAARAETPPVETVPGDSVPSDSVPIATPTTSPISDPMSAPSTPAAELLAPEFTTTTTTTVPKRLPRRPDKVNIGSVVVELSTQRTFVFTPSRRLVAIIPVSTGKNNTTPVGSFRVFSKSAQAFYSADPRERMRWMVRFTKGREGDNIGFHGIPYRVTTAGERPLPTPIGKKPSSHGCIRMRVHDAKWLFDNIDESTPVRVVRNYRSLRG